MNKRDDLCLVRAIAQPVRKAAIISAMLHVGYYSTQRLSSAVMHVRRLAIETKQRRDIETIAFAVAVIINAQGILRRCLSSVDNRGSRLFIRSDIVAERIALSRHAKVK